MSKKCKATIKAWLTVEFEDDGVTDQMAQAAEAFECSSCNFDYWEVFQVEEVEE